MATPSRILTWRAPESDVTERLTPSLTLSLNGRQADVRK